MALLFLILFGLLSLASIAVFVPTLRAQHSEQADPHLRQLRDLRALWIGTVVFWLSWMSGPVGATLLFGVFSFLALREFITLAHTRRSDHRSLILAFFVVLPLQYVLVGLRSFDLFSVFIPVYVFLAIPVLSALAGDPERFLERNAKIQWGIMVCVFGLSHAPALLLLEFPDYAGRGAFLLFFLVIVAAAAQIAQELASRWLRRRPVARHIDRSFSLPRLGGRRAGRGAGGRGAVLDHAVPHLAGAGDGPGGRRLRHAGRVRDEGAEEGRRRALLGQPRVGHRRGGPARPGGAAVLCRAGVLPLGALVLQPGAVKGRILGIDPGLQTTGFGVVEVDGRGWPTWPAAPSAPPRPR